jgi:hypothetical protein
MRTKIVRATYLLQGMKSEFEDAEPEKVTDALPLQCPEHFAGFVISE